ncbi:MAG: response regulator transcription factor [Acidobacteria bacterium]|nr:response regulator transcription factor [Acidobacteriota bacterium]
MVEGTGAIERDDTDVNVAPVAVFLVEDHVVLRQSLALVVDGEDDLQVVGEAERMTQARFRIRATRPDVVVLDVHLPDGNGLDLCASIRRELPSTRVVVLTGDASSAVAEDAVAAGADALVLKHVGCDRLLDELRHVTGRTPRSADTRVVQPRRSSHRSPEQSAVARLTDQERQVLELVADGLSNRQVAARLFLAEKTVKNYMTSVMRKLGVPSRTAAALIATRARFARERCAPVAAEGQDPVCFVLERSASRSSAPGHRDAV